MARRIPWIASLACLLLHPPVLAGTDPLVLVSPPDPLAACTADTGIFQSGVLVPDSEVETWLSVDPANPHHYVAVWQQDRWSTGGSRGIVGAVSFDDGVNWEQFVVPGLTLCSGGFLARASDPWLSFSPNGNLYLASLIFGDDVGTNIVAASRSIDGGLTWESPSVLVAGQAFVAHDKEAITADPADPNFVYTVWDVIDGTTNTGPTLFSRSVDTGITWSLSKVLYNPGVGLQTLGNQLVVMPDGSLRTFFSEIDGRDPANTHYFLAFKQSVNRGVTWGPAGPALRVAEMDPVSAIANASRTILRDGAGLFDVAVDPVSGWLYAVWQDGGISRDGTPVIAFSMSRDGGASWSVPVAVNRTPADLEAAQRQAFTPSVAVTRDGRIGVSYSDFRFDDAGTGTLTDRWLVWCHPLAADCTRADRWRDEDRLTDASFDVSKAPVARGLFLGDYAGLDAAGGDFVAAWAMPHDADRASIFVRRVTAPMTADPEDAAFWKKQVAVALAGRKGAVRKKDLVNDLKDIRAEYDVFDDVKGLKKARKVLSARAGDPASILRREILALLLNMASGRLSPSIEAQAGRTLSEVVRQIVSVAADPAADPADVAGASDLAASINAAVIPAP